MIFATLHDHGIETWAELQVAAFADDFTYDRSVERLYVRLTSWRPKAGKDADP